MLTNAAVKAARPRSAAYKLSDGRGLHLYVAPSNLRSWRLRFRWQGREQLLTLGNAHEMTLDQARASAELARHQLAQGIDPRVCDIAQTGEIRAFEYAARRWHAHRLPGWTEVHAADVLASLERDVFPAIGALTLDSIRAPAIVKLLRAVEGRGAVETARRLQQRIAKVFAFACSEGWTENNPAAGVTEALACGRPPRRQPAIVDADELRQLLDAAELVDARPAVKLASRFLALTAVRLACVRWARWEQIEDLDGEAPLWRIPAARMKLAAAKKLDAANDHLVPLSPAAVAVLRAARELGHGAGLIFPGGDYAAPIGEGAISSLYVRAGFAGRHVPHGWRASFSTILNLQMPEERGEIDRALGHVGGGREEAELGINRKVEGAYNRGVHIDRRRTLFDAWAEILIG